MRKRKGKKIVGLLILVCIGVLFVKGCGNSRSSEKTRQDVDITSISIDATEESEETEILSNTEYDNISYESTEDETADTNDTDAPPEAEAGASSDEIRPEFKEALDSYEAFFDEYIAFMEKYAESDDAMGMLADYTNYLMQYADMMEKLQALDDDDLSTAEAAYYVEVMSRIEQKLLKVSM